MRRTLALLGAAAMVITGLAGPANASEINAAGEVRFAANELNNTGVHPGTSIEPEEAWFHLQSTTGVDESLNGLGVLGCIAGNVDPTVFVNSYGTSDFAPVAADTFVTADPVSLTAPSPDVRWSMSASTKLEGGIFRLELVSDINGGPNDVIASTQNNEGSLSGLCTAQLPSEQ